MLAGRGRAERAAFRSYGTNLGLAFQLVDDALDYGGASSNLGKRVGDDFREGKITLPVVLSYRRGTDADRTFWRRVLEEGEIGDGDLDHAIGLMRAPPRHRRYGRARAAFRRRGPRRAGAVSRFRPQIGASRSGRLLHRTRQLSRPVPTRRLRDGHKAAILFALRARQLFG